MSEEYNADETEKAETPSINRRRFVKALGATTGAAAFTSTGLGSAMAKTEQRATETQINRALKSTQVQSLLKSLNDPSINRNKTSVIEISHGETSITQTTLNTELGGIDYTEIQSSNGGLPTTALFSISDSEYRRKLPNKYRDVPGEQAVLVGRAKKDPLLIRTASKKERPRLVDAVPIPSDNMIAATTSEMDGFRVDDRKPKSNAQAFQVTLPDSNTDSVSVDHISSKTGDLRTQDLHDPACNQRNWCITCAKALTAYAGCGFACASTAVTGPIGAALCVACAVGSGMLTGYACEQCVAHCNPFV